MPGPSKQWIEMRWGTFPYTLLPEPDSSSELARLSGATHVANVHCVTFQPCLNPKESSQDRYVVQDWALADGVWKFLAVFDGAPPRLSITFSRSQLIVGHAGHELVDHAVDVLPSKIKANLSSFLDTQHETKAAISPDHISEILREDIAAFDHSVANDITSLFPGGVEQISALSDNEIRRIINDDQENSRKIVLGMRGTTALLALVNPTRSRLWVASLGDSQAGIK
jgi:pyruvate dehydrogenase phosphatase